MPRLVITAIAVNLSFYICAAMVDVSNILGANLYEFISSMSIDEGYDAGIGEHIGGVLVGGTIAGIALIGLIIMVLLNLGTVAVGVLLVLAVLALREVLVTVLIIVSPVAFVLYLLPNTEKWFKKWLSEFTRCLFIYPAIAAVWGATTVVTNIVLASTISNGLMKFIMLCMIQLVPVAAILPIMKMGGQALGKLQGLARSGLDKTPIKDIGNNLGKAAKSGGLTALGNRMNRKWTRGVDDEGNVVYKDSQGRVAKGKKHDRIHKKWGSQKTDLFGRTYAQKRSGGNFTQIAASKATRFLAGLGDGNLKKQTENLATTAQGNTDAAKRTSDLELRMKNTAQSLKREVEKQEYEIELKGKSHALDAAAKMFLAKQRAEGATEGSQQFQMLTRAQQMGGNTAEGMAAASARGEFQGKIADTRLASLAEQYRTGIKDKDGNDLVSAGSDLSAAVRSSLSAGHGADQIQMGDLGSLSLDQFNAGEGGERARELFANMLRQQVGNMSVSDYGTTEYNTLRSALNGARASAAGGAGIATRAFQDFQAKDITLANASARIQRQPPPAPSP